MSTSAQFPSSSTEITCIAPEHVEPKLVIADILRTQYCIPGSIFLVEGIDIVYTSRSKRWRAVRLLLGDGELCVQALLSTAMHGFVDRGEIAFGSHVKLEQFRLEWTDLSGNILDVALTGGREKTAGNSPGGRDQMAYLVVEDLVLVGWNNTLIDLMNGGNVKNRAVPIQDHEEVTGSTPTAVEAATDVDARQVPEEANNSIGVHSEPGGADDDFEVMSISEKRTTQNRTELAMEAQSKEYGASTSGYLPWLSNDPTNPLKLTKLRAIPNLPYKQNWSVNILAVVSAISDVEPSGLPPYRQRQARLADPSTDKHVLLTVFLDPQEFAPSVGSVVLLLGVKNHRFDGGSLKKYASDRARVGESWWYENPAELSWCDVAGLARWWRNR
ncbi:hypothetical protein F5X99DRAFT_70142 [Biscogniauxia marginata]|nr:hypothetical protein F5X99DRAFT_70142 [Biscogniauxia marginata]